jgi:GT2 family glycosyltransferase
MCLRQQISFIVIAHKNSSTLKTCLESVESQSAPSDELILVLNNPDNPTRRIAESALKWTVVYEEFPGAASARNRGALESTHKFLAFLDSDIFLSSGWAEKMLSYFSDSWMAAGQSRIKMQKGPGLVNFLKRISYLTFFSRFYLGAQLNKGLTLLTLDTAGLMVKRDWFEKIGGFRSQFQRLEDTDFSLRLLYDGADIFLAEDAEAIELDDDESLLSYVIKIVQSCRYLPLLHSSHGLSFGLPFGPGSNIPKSLFWRKIPFNRMINAVLKGVHLFGLATSPFSIIVEPKMSPVVRPNLKAQVLEGRDPFTRKIRIGSKVRFLDIKSKRYFRS